MRCNMGFKGPMGIPVVLNATDSPIKGPQRRENGCCYGYGWMLWKSLGKGYPGITAGLWDWFINLEDENTLRDDRDAKRCTKTFITGALTSNCSIKYWAKKNKTPSSVCVCSLRYRQTFLHDQIILPIGVVRQIWFSESSLKTHWAFLRRGTINTVRFHW